MQSLELKIPPPAVALIIAAAMWGLSLTTPSVVLPAFVRLVAAIAIAATGVGIAIAGIVAFRHARTTVNPLTPEATSSLVTSGIYRHTRNPMYVGLALGLLAWAVFVSSAPALLGPVAFVLYMNRFQVGAEERVLSTMFGAAYAAYQTRVRRWL